MPNEIKLVGKECSCGVGFTHYHRPGEGLRTPIIAEDENETVSVPREWLEELVRLTDALQTYYFGDAGKDEKALKAHALEAGKYLDNSK